MGEIDTINRFIVAAYGDGKVVVRNPPHESHALTRAAALNLAAWLVAMTDTSGQEFAKVLAAVRNA